MHNHVQGKCVCINTKLQVGGEAGIDRIIKLTHIMLLCPMGKPMEFTKNEK